MGEGFAQGLGPLAGGFAQGVVQGQQILRQRDLVEIQKKQLKVEEEKVKRAEAAAQQNAQLMQMLFGGLFPGAAGAPPGAMPQTPAAPPPGTGLSDAQFGGPVPTPDLDAPAPAAPPGQAPTLDATTAPSPPPTAPQAPPAAAPAGAPALAGNRFLPSVTFGADGPKVTLQAREPNLQRSVQTMQDPTNPGMAILVETLHDPATGQSVQRPIGRPAPSDAIVRAGQQAQALGLQPTAPLFGQIVGAILTLDSLPPEQRTEGLARLQGFIQAIPPAERGTPPQDMMGPGGAFDLGAIRESAEARSLAQKGREQRQEEQVRREERPLEGRPREQATLLEEAERQLIGIEQTFRRNPQLVGKPFGNRDLVASLATAIDAQLASAQKGQYVPGALASQTRQFLGKASPEEVGFARSILDVTDILLRARSGAAITDDEFIRLRQTLFTAFDQPNTFGPAVRRVRESVGAQIDNLYRGATTPASQRLKAREAGREAAEPATTAPAAGAPSAPGEIAEGALLRRSDGTMWIRQGGHWVPRGAP